jgi:hypothetical protein
MIILVNKFKIFFKNAFAVLNMKAKKKKKPECSIAMTFDAYNGKQLKD